MTTHQTAPTQYIQINDTTLAYRRFGALNGVPLLFLHHFRASMDWWDPLLVNGIAKHRPVILLDNAGVGKSSGSVDGTVKAMAGRVLEFLGVLDVKEVDLLEFSMGGYVAQMVGLDGPKGLVRRMIICGSGPSWGEDLKTHDQKRMKEINDNAAGPEATLKNMQKLFFYPTESSSKAAEGYWSRIHERQPSTSGEERAELVSWKYADQGAGLQAMAGALAHWSSPENRGEGSYDRLGELDVPVLIGQGKDDFMIPTVNSFVMQQRVKNARLKVFPDSGHGFLFQWAEEWSGDVVRFLS